MAVVVPDDKDAYAIACDPIEEVMEGPAPRE